MSLTMAGATALAAGLSAGGSLFGNIYSNTSSSQRDREARRWAERQQERANVYNSPAMMMQRLRHAGLNPNLMAGQPPSEAISVAPPSVSQPQYSNPFQDFPANLQSYMQSQANIQLTEEQAEAQRLANKEKKRELGEIEDLNKMFVYDPQKGIQFKVLEIGKDGKAEDRYLDMKDFDNWTDGEKQQFYVGVPPTLSDTIVNLNKNFTEVKHLNILTQKEFNDLSAQEKSNYFERYYSYTLKKMKADSDYSEQEFEAYKEYCLKVLPEEYNMLVAQYKGAAAEEEVTSALYKALNNEKTPNWVKVVVGSLFSLAKFMRPIAQARVGKL